jgi:hypothetical protein
MSDRPAMVTLSKWPVSRLRRAAQSTPIQEAFNDPGIAADRRTAKAVAPPAFVLKIEDCA